MRDLRLRSEAATGIRAKKFDSNFKIELQGAPTSQRPQSQHNRHRCSAEIQFEILRSTFPISPPSRRYNLSLQLRSFLNGRHDASLRTNPPIPHPPPYLHLNRNPPRKIYKKASRIRAPQCTNLPLRPLDLLQTIKLRSVRHAKNPVW